MPHLRQRFKTMKFAALAVVTFACCSGCSLGDALLDGAFLGVSETVSTLFNAAFTG